MRTLALAPLSALTEASARFGPLPECIWLRRPEVGLSMVRARTGGTGAQFNLGEMTLTRCAMRLPSGTMGVAYVAGRSLRHAELAATFDALLQTDAHARVAELVLAPLDAVLAAERAAAHAAARATRVEFVTMVRGEGR